MTFVRVPTILNHMVEDGSRLDAVFHALANDARRWGFAGPERADGAVFDSRLTITLRPAPEGSTMLTLVHEHLDALSAAMPYVAQNAGPGWELVLDKLAATIRQ